MIRHYEVGNLPINFSDRLDEGTFATIYKTTLRRKPAVVKCFKTHISKRKILQIAIKLRNLKHNNICRLRGYSIKPAALIFEYCVAHFEDEVSFNLSQFISVLNENEYFVWKDRLNYIKQATLGLNYLHKNGITHRDFKPANLLVSGEHPNISVKVTDFDEVVGIKETLLATMTINNSI